MTPMTLVKAQFVVLDNKDDDKSRRHVLDVNFNPKELTFEMGQSYSQDQSHGTPLPLSLHTAENPTLGMTLYFDTYELGCSVREGYMRYLEELIEPKDVKTAPGASSKSPTPGKKGSAGTGQATKAAPTVVFIWGTFEFKGMVESLSQKYTMFLPDGTPVRAEAILRIKKAPPAEKAAGAGNDTTEGKDKPTWKKIQSEGGSALPDFDPSTDYDDPFDILNNAGQAEGINGGKPGGLAQFMEDHGNAIWRDGLTGAVYGGKQGAFEGILGASGETGLGRDVFGDNAFGQGLDDLAMGEDVNVVSIAGGGSGPLGDLGAGFNAGIRRDGTKVSVGTSTGGGFSTSDGTPVVGVEQNNTMTSDGGSASSHAAGIGVGGAGTSGDSSPGGVNYLDTSRDRGGARGGDPLPGAGGGGGVPGAGTGGRAGAGGGPSGTAGGPSGSGTAAPIGGGSPGTPTATPVSGAGGGARGTAGNPSGTPSGTPTGSPAGGSSAPTGGTSSSTSGTPGAGGGARADAGKEPEPAGGQPPPPPTKPKK